MYQPWQRGRSDSILTGQIDALGCIHWCGRKWNHKTCSLFLSAQHKHHHLSTSHSIPCRPLNTIHWVLLQMAVSQAVGVPKSMQTSRFLNPNPNYAHFRFQWPRKSDPQHANDMSTLAFSGNRARHLLKLCSQRYY